MLLGPLEQGGPGSVQFGGHGVRGREGLARQSDRDPLVRVLGRQQGEPAGFKYAKQKFEAANPGAKVNLKVVPYDGFFSGIDRAIQSNTAPDLFRVDYTTIGKYSSKNVLLDVSPYFTNEVGIPPGACGTR